MAEEKKDNLVLPGLLGAASVYGLAKGAPEGGYIKSMSDSASNFLQGYYGKGAGKFRKGQLFANEAIKASARLARTGKHPIQTLAYQQTGISPYLKGVHTQTENAIGRITQEYIDGKIPFTQAKLEIRNMEKRLHFKLTSDYSNNFLFKKQPKNAISSYAKKYVSTSSKKEFINLMGGSDEAKYAITRQPDIKNYKGVRLLKYKNLPFSDVLRGAQFDNDFYGAMKKLKGFQGTADDAAIMLSKYKNLPNPKVLNNGKLAFTVSPSIKPQYDWGGYNSVGIWDPKNPHKIRIGATDLRDVQGFKSGAMGTRPVVNYVASKEIDIKVAADKIKEVDAKTPLDDARKRKYTPRKYDPEARMQKAKSLRVGGTRNQLWHEFDQTFKKYDASRKRAAQAILHPIKTLKSKSGKRLMSKVARTGLKGVGRLAGPVGLAASILWTAHSMFSDDE